MKNIKRVKRFTKNYRWWLCLVILFKSHHCLSHIKIKKKNKKKKKTTWKFGNRHKVCLIKNTTDNHYHILRYWLTKSMKRSINFFWLESICWIFVTNLWTIKITTSSTTTTMVIIKENHLTQLLITKFDYQPVYKI